MLLKNITFPLTSLIKEGKKMTQEIGTLKELNLQPGDVVEYTFGGWGDPFSYKVTREWVDSVLLWEEADRPYWRIVSRAPRPEADTPKLWRDMSPEEKGALLLAHHEGKVIEVWDSKSWVRRSFNVWAEGNAYRVRPEPKRVTIGLYIGLDRNRFPYPIGTIDLLDGKPDMASIRMEEL